MALSISCTTINLDPGFGAPAAGMMPFSPMASQRLDPMAGMNPMLGGGMMPSPELAYQGLMTQLVGLLAGLLLGSLGQGQQGGGMSPSGGMSASSGGGGASSSGAGAGAVDPSQFSGGTDTSRKLAAAAKAEATNGDSNGGLCFRDAARALRTVGINTSGASAYMAADQLANNPKVKEIKVAQADLPKLPPGAIVVWDKGPGHPHGHISIAMGDGMEASDLMRKQITNYGTSFRVFMPV